MIKNFEIFLWLDEELQIGEIKSKEPYKHMVTILSYMGQSVHSYVMTSDWESKLEEKRYIGCLSGGKVETVHNMVQTDGTKRQN